MTSNPASNMLFPESTHPYGVRTILVFGSNVELIMSENDFLLPFADNHTLKIIQGHNKPTDQANFLKQIIIQLEAFRSAHEAERAGKLIALSVLWVAASKKITIAFAKWTGDFPFAIYDRTQSAGNSLSAEARVYTNIKPEDFTSIAEGAYKLGIDIAPNILTSLEFYASARMETTERARFIGLMTALEALAVQHDYGSEVVGLLNDLASQIEKSQLLQGEENNSIRNSLASRLKQLRQESIRQAIIRTVKEHIADQNTIRFVDEAYRTRSKILHEGLRTQELHIFTNRLEDIMRQIYSSKLNLPLARPIS